MHETVPALAVLACHLQIWTEAVTCHLSDFAAVNENGYIDDFVWLCVIRCPAVDRLVGHFIQMTV